MSTTATATAAATATTTAARSWWRAHDKAGQSCYRRRQAYGCERLIEPTQTLEQDSWTWAVDRAMPTQPSKPQSGQRCQSEQLQGRLWSDVLLWPVLVAVRAAVAGSWWCHLYGWLCCCCCCYEPPWDSAAAINTCMLECYKHRCMTHRQCCIRPCQAMPCHAAARWDAMTDHSDCCCLCCSFLCSSRLFPTPGMRALLVFFPHTVHTPRLHLISRL